MRRERSAHSYDAQGRPQRTVDANGHVARGEWDGAGRKVLEAVASQTPDEERTVTRYDRVGNAVESKSLRVTGSTFDVRHSYDDANRQVRSEDGTGRVTSKAFDEAGNLLCVKEALGTGHLAHGAAAGKTLEELRQVACGPGGYVTQYAYDEVGRQTSLTDANGSTWVTAARTGA